MKALDEIKTLLRNKADTSKSFLLQKYFKADGTIEDQFLGLKVPDIRKIASQFKNVSVEDVRELIQSKYHEERLMALILLTHLYSSADEKLKGFFYSFYKKYSEHVDNWDLVDVSAPSIVGSYIYAHNEEEKYLFDLAKSKKVWKRRIAILATLFFIRRGSFGLALMIAEYLVEDSEDMVQKAVGWMLREIGKRDEGILISFLNKNYRKMPRVMLRYSIEKLSVDLRKYYIKK